MNQKKKKVNVLSLEMCSHSKHVRDFLSVHCSRVKKKMIQ